MKVTDKSEYYNGMKHGVTKGYYLVVPTGRYFIGASINEARKRIDRACDKHLSESNGWDYWIDYSHGKDIFGNAAWSNLDHSVNIVD